MEQLSNGYQMTKPSGLCVQLQEIHQKNWKKFKAEVLAMVKQLGISTFFLTLSCPDLWWKEFLEVMQKPNEAEFDI